MVDSFEPVRIGVIGGGPAGSALAVLLARKGCEVALWDDGKKPDLVVGESLIPAVVPVLRKLGIEEEVAAISVRKPGVSFQIDPNRTVRFCFTSVEGVLPTYAYNVPRPQFDHILSRCAGRSGARIVRERASIGYDPDSDRVLLDPESLERAGWNRQPDLVVDASGRGRLFARSLKIPHRAGPRKDMAIFAHFAGVPPLDDDPDGQVTIARSASGGWSWRIPLRGATSVGVILPEKAAREFGRTAEERLKNALVADPILAPATATARRLSDVATYSNYQLISERGCGANWVMTGDAFGFVDPMLSPGLCLALNSASWLANAIPTRRGMPLAPALECFIERLEGELEGWTELIEQFYNGSIFNLYFDGAEEETEFSNPFGKLMKAHVSKHISCMCSGGSTSNSYSRNLLRMSVRHAVDPAGAANFAIA